MVQYYKLESGPGSSHLEQLAWEKPEITRKSEKNHLDRLQYIRTACDLATIKVRIAKQLVTGTAHE